MSLTRRGALRSAAAAGLAILLPACGRGPAGSESGTPQEAAARGALRLDLRHHIASGAEGFTLTRLRAESMGSGSRNPRGPGSDWGDYRLSLYEPGSGALLYRSGFDSNLDRNSASAATRLSVRFPLPQETVNAAIEKRRGETSFQPVWNTAIDPHDGAIDRSAPAAEVRVETIVWNGESAARIDIAVLGDGYREADHAKFIADAKRATGHLFSVEPLKTRVRDFNVHAVFIPSSDSGVTDPYLRLVKKTAFRCAYGSGAAERTLSVGDEYALREAASAAPYDFLLVLANARRYGGSAYFGGPAVVSIDSAAARYLVIHEFAHVLAGLADEYYIPAGAGPAYTGNIEPWNPNVTLSAGKAKWPLTHSEPAQWNKAEYDRYFDGYVRRYFALRARRAGESAVEKFMQEEKQRQAALLSSNPRRVGLYEGGNGYAKGVYRSEVDCIMFSLQSDRFCSACAAALNRAIDEHAK